MAEPETSRTDARRRSPRAEPATMTRTGTSELADHTCLTLALAEALQQILLPVRTPPSPPSRHARQLI